MRNVRNSVPIPRELTPTELALRNRAIDAERRIEVQREHYERVIEEMKAKRAKELAAGGRVVLQRKAPLEAKNYIKNAEADLRLKAAHLWRCQVEALREELCAMQVRIDAGMYRRTHMLYLLTLILKCEDDESLTDAEHDAIMDRVIWDSRNIISRELLARKSDRLREGKWESAHAPAQKGGA